MTVTNTSSRKRVGAELEDRTLSFAADIISFVSTFPRSEAASVIVRQLVRSGTSVGANYREANRAESGMDFAHKVAVSVKEAAETEYWLQLSERCQFGDTARQIGLAREANELLAILSTILRRARRS